MRRKHAAYQKKVNLKSRMDRERAWNAGIRARITRLGDSRPQDDRVQ